MQNDKLLPCPFCGREAKVSKTDEDHYQVICTNCPCSLGRFWFWKKEDAIKYWNTRKPMDRIVDRLEHEIFVSYDRRSVALDNVELHLSNVYHGEIKAYSTAIRIVKEEGGLHGTDN